MGKKKDKKRALAGPAAKLPAGAAAAGPVCARTADDFIDLAMVNDFRGLNNVGAGADLDALSACDGQNASHVAASNGFDSFVRTLAELGADLNVKARDCGHTALHKAAYMGRSDTARVLVELGADASLRDIDGLTAREMAIRESTTKWQHQVAMPRGDHLQTVRAIDAALAGRTARNVLFSERPADRPDWNARSNAKMQAAINHVAHGAPGEIAPTRYTCSTCGGLTSWGDAKGPCNDCRYVTCGPCANGPERSTCDCPASNFGLAYADEPDGEPFMGAGRHGVRYTGPFKCLAQINLEERLLGLRKPTPDDPGALHLGRDAVEWLETCCAHACGEAISRAAAKRCARCKSVLYCSVECQRADWKAGHKRACGEFLAPADLPFVPLAMREYKERFGHFPSAQAQPAGATTTTTPIPG